MKYFNFCSHSCSNEMFSSAADILSTFSVCRQYTILEFKRFIMWQPRDFIIPLRFAIIKSGGLSSGRSG